jgi:hypothetical protein
MVGLGTKLLISRWIRAISCVYSGGSIVYNYWCPLSPGLKVQVKGDIYTHNPVDESIFDNPILRDMYENNKKPATLVTGSLILRAYLSATTLTETFATTL